MKLRFGCRFRRMLVAIGLGVPLSAGAAASFAMPDFGGDAWQPLHFPKIKRHTVYDSVVDGGRPVLRATSECSASAMIAPVDGLDLSATPRLKWRWKVDRTIPAALSERQKGGDDFAARVYVAFRFDPAGASTWELLKRRAAERIYGAELPGNTLSYVWSQNEPEGHSWSNPYTAAAHMLSRGRGSLPDWREESANLRTDYLNSFGTEAPPVLFVGVMTDSDDSCSAASARFADFRFDPADESDSE